MNTKNNPIESNQKSASINFEFFDPPALTLDHDKGAGNFQVPDSGASFFSYLFGVNQNYKRKRIELWEGGPDFTESQFEKVGVFIIEDVEKMFLGTAELPEGGLYGSEKKV